MVRKGLPKKYAKMGFKKGWAAYKRSKGGRRKKSTTRKTTRKRRSYTPKRRRTTMARRRKKKGRRKATLSISALLIIILMLERMGVFTQAFWMKIQNGDVSGAVAEIQGSLRANFMGGGLPVTVAAFISVAVATYLVKMVAGRKGIDLRRPQRITV